MHHRHFRWCAASELSVGSQICRMSTGLFRGGVRRVQSSQEGRELTWDRRSTPARCAGRTKSFKFRRLFAGGERSANVMKEVPNIYEQLLKNEDFVSIMVHRLNVWGLPLSYVNNAFAKEARRCRAEYMTVFVRLRRGAPPDLLEGTELQEAEAKLVNTTPSLSHLDWVFEENKRMWPEKYRMKHRPMTTSS